MKCPYCGEVGHSQVIDTSTEGRGNIRRRRECKACGKRFSTIERPIVATPMLIKSSGERQEFDREKLIQGIRVACAKRPVSTAEINRLIDSVEAHLQSLGREEVSSRVVGDMVVEGLKELDPIAYIRYAIVYLGLDDLDAVRAETDKLLSEQVHRKKGSRPSS
jgi:transcriptional repressor NrdR